jgi:hypothetical protein
MVAARFRGYYDRQAKERQGQRAEPWQSQHFALMAFRSDLGSAAAIW